MTAGTGTETTTGRRSVGPTRLALGAIGVLVGVYGAWLVLSRQEGLDRLTSVVLWLAGGVVLHDFVLAPVVLGLAWAARGLSAGWRRSITVAVVVVGSLSVLAFPVLGRYGARDDNPTLLPRHYLASWLVLLAVTAVLVVLASRFGSRLGGRRTAAPDPVPGPVPDPVPDPVPHVVPDTGATGAGGGDDGPGAGGR